MRALDGRADNKPHRPDHPSGYRPLLCRLQFACMLEMLRLALLLAMLGAASYHDVRTREIPDYIWIVGGAAGAALYIFDWSTVDYFVLFSMGTGGAMALLAWRFFPMGEADVLAVLSSCVVCPVSFGVMNPVVMFLGGLVLEHVAALLYNLRYNLEDLCRGSLFGCIMAPWYVKAAAFYSMHRRRSHERFTFCAERCADGRRTITLKTPSPDSKYEDRTGVFVTWAMPAFPFMTASLIIGVLLTAAV